MSCSTKQVPLQVWKYREFERVRGLIISAVKEIVCYPGEAPRGLLESIKLMCVVFLRVT
jgi:hypothetical protein